MTKIKAPKADPVRKGSRGLVESALAFVPYAGGILIRMLRHFVPTKIERDTKKWQSEITDQSNQHEDRLDAHEEAIFGRTALSSAASAIAKRLAEQSPDGLGDHFPSADDYSDVLTPPNAQESEDAIHELANLGLVSITPILAGPLRFRLTQKFYEQIDPQVMGWNPKDDAKTLAKLILADERLAHSTLLHKASGWSKRRFNPALQYLADSCVDPRRVSQALQPDYATASLILAPADKAAMRRFVAE